MQLRTRWIKVLVCTAALSGLALWGVDWWLNPSRPTLAAANVEAIEIHLFDVRFTRPTAGQAASETIVTDKQVIRNLLAVFAGATRGSEHKADRSGVIVVRRKDGGREELSILPGFRDERYEYRYAGRMNYIDRTQFLAALESAGILSVALAPP